MDHQQPETETYPYGKSDSSFQAAGGIEGIEKLVNEFYHQMDTLPEAKIIREMHPKDLTNSIDKLSRFLCGWLGGPKRFQEKYGSIKLPQAHAQFPIGQTERETWLRCMEKAADKQPYQEDFKLYLLKKLQFPASKIQNKK
jgi:hemoglobin